MSALEVLLAVVGGLLLAELSIMVVRVLGGEWLMVDKATWILDRCWWRGR